jgi:catecholate siderophore receptor
MPVAGKAVNRAKFEILHFDFSGGAMATDRPSCVHSTVGALRLRRIKPSLLVSALALGTAFPALAQQATQPGANQQGANQPLDVPAASVEGEAPAPENTLTAPVGINRMPGTVQDTPQMINVITQQQMRDQGVTTLDQALRNVPGITLAIGEGGGGMNGDQFRIRGLEAKGDIYTDGLRDFGNYNRDSFNYEEIQVLKGPSAQAFGRGTTGGAISTTSKTPTLDQFGSASGGIGNGMFYRGTLDYNMPIDNTTAVRLNLMGQNSQSQSRDYVESERWGIAPTIGFGLGTDTTWIIGYQHQSDNRVPDYGIPVMARPGSNIALPATEFGVDSKNWYGSVTDSDNSNVDSLTSRFTHKATDWLKLYNDTKVGRYDRYFTPTAVSCNNSATSTCLSDFFDGNPATVPMASRGGPGPFDQQGWGAQNITTAIAEFNTAELRHELVGGLDVSYEFDDRQQYVYNPSRPTTSLLNPDPSNTNGYTITHSPAATAVKETNSWNAGLFASDRLWLTPEWSVIGGVRVDHFATNYSSWGPSANVTEIDTESTFVNPRGSIVFEPTKTQTYYVSYAKSAQPSGGFVSQAPTPLTGENSDLEPEQHQIYEIGAKYGALGGQLGLSGSLFRIEKSNAKETDATTGTIVSSGDEQLVQGLELGATGRLTKEWGVTASYTYLDAETVSSTTAANVGKGVQFVAHNAASLWTTYDVLRDLTLGGGLTYQSAANLNASNSAEIPSQVTFDAMASYKFGDVRFNFNVYNLFEELRYTQLFSNRVVPDEKRLFILTTSVDF